MHALLLRTSAAVSAAITLGLAASAAPQLPDRTPPTAVPRWQQLGPLAGAGPYVARFATSASRPGVVWASSSAGLARSDDRGATWTIQSPWPRRFGLAPFLDVSNVDPDRFVIGRFRGGMDVTHDGGATWWTPSVPPATSTVYNVRFDAVDRDTIFVAGVGGVWRSRDGGDTFDQVVDAATFGGALCSRLLPDRNNRLRIFAVCPNVGFLVTEDGGDTWTQRPFPPGGNFPLCLAIDPMDGRRLLFGWSEVWVTEDGASTWSLIHDSPSELFDSAAFDPYDRDHVLLGSRLKGIVATEDGGVTWADVADPGLEDLGGNPLGIQFSVPHHGEVVVGGLGGFARSTDGGRTFAPANTGLDPHAYVDSIAVDPFDPTHLVAKTGGSAYVSLDSGATWTESVAGPAFVGYEVVADQGVPGRFYTGAQGGRLWRSDDGGLTFTQVFEDPVVYFWNLEPHPTLGNVLFGAGRGVQRSDDGGLTFTNLGLPSNWVWDVAVAPSDPDVIYGSTSSTVYASHDGGATWTAATTPPATIVRDLEVDPNDPMRAWACVPLSGLFRTEDGGATWTLMPSSSELAQTAHVPAGAPNLLLTGDARDWHAFGSRDAGLTNAAIGFGLGSVVRRFTSTTTEIFAATAGGGVFALR